MSAREAYHIEILAEPEAGSAEGAIMQRVTVRTETLDAARERALRLFARARAPQRAGLPAEFVRIVDGAGTELFRWSRFDEPAPG